jgi:hypothetical protein
MENLTEQFVVDSVHTDTVAERYCILRDMKKDSRNGQIEIDIRPYIQRYALNTTLTM